MKENNKFVNEDTYQTLTELKLIHPLMIKLKPLWKR